MPEIKDKKTRTEKWRLVGCLVSPAIKQDLAAKIKENQKLYGKEDERSSESGFVRVLLRKTLYPTDEVKPEPKKPEPKKESEEGDIDL